jgi:hypothetical protein
MEQSSGREAEDMEAEQARATLHRRGAEVGGLRRSDNHIGTERKWCICEILLYRFSWMESTAKALERGRPNRQLHSLARGRKQQKLIWTMSRGHP